uniref:Peptidase S1 domain-containing protein n=1 Tax=Anopheles epiroticus TaxID=199890 RepID=A0A182PQS7_9DIPT
MAQSLLEVHRNASSDTELPEETETEQPVAEVANDVPPPTPPTCPTCATPSCTITSSDELRIVGGSNVSPKDKYPWIVLLTYLNSPSGQGTLINDRTVVTTATIVNSMPVIMHIRALLGVYNRAATNASISSLKIKTAYAHPGYSSTDLFSDNIGLLELKVPLTSYKIACLPIEVPEARPVSKATVIGWGATFPNGPLSNILQEVELQMYPPLLCFTASAKVTSKNLCGGPGESVFDFKTTCTGDGGDPLVVKNGASWVLIGIALDIPEIQCGVNRRPAMFTNVIPYLNWIATYGPGCKCGA